MYDVSSVINCLLSFIRLEKICFIKREGVAIMTSQYWQPEKYFEDPKVGNQ